MILLGVWALSCTHATAAPVGAACGEFLRMGQYDFLVDPAELALELDSDPYPEMIPRALEGGFFRVVHSNEHAELRSGESISYGSINKAYFRLGFDLEGDGDTDLLYITVEDDQTGLVLLCNDGDAGFSLPFGVQVVPQMNIFHAEDLTGDGVMDLLAVGSRSGVFRLTDVGPLGFEIEQLADHSASGQNVSWGSFGDIDDDGDTDFVGSRTGAIVTYIAQEDGSLQRVVDQVSGSVVYVRLVDLDLDGDLDLFGAGGLYVRIFRNDGPGMWTGIGDTEFGRSIHTMHRLDANGDEYPDFVVAYDGGTYMFSGMPEPPYASSARVTDGIEMVGVGDFNSDGIDEVGVIDSFGGARSVQLASDGSFVETMYTPLAGRSTHFKSGLVTDLQGDGDPDFVVRHTGHQVVINEGGESLRSASVQINGSTNAVELVDLNNDGLLDIVAVRPSQRALVVFLGAGGGAFEPRQFYPFDRYPNEVAVGDVDADGAVDIVLISTFEDVATILYNDGHGVFEQIDELQTGPRPSGVEIGDLNNNSTPDLVFAYQSGSQRVGVSLGLGGRAFLPPIQYSTLNTALQLELGDVNGDGFLDIVTAGTRNGGSDQGQSIAVLPNNGQGFGFFLPAVGVELLHDPQMIRVADLNQDGLSDVVVLGYINSSENLYLRTLIAKNGGEFVEYSRWDSGVDPELDTELDLRLFDRDQDGDLDVLAWIGNYSGISVPEEIFLNDSTGRLVPSNSGIGVGLGSGLFAAGDLTDDGQDELVFVHSSLYTLNVLHERCVSYCLPDLYLSGGLDYMDVSAFLAIFQARGLAADWNGDGAWNFFDVSGFLEDYLAGCP